MFLSSAVTCFFAWECYNADLTATMTAGAPPARIRSFQDILDHDYQGGNTL